jgi:hypothetical protein
LLDGFSDLRAMETLPKIGQKITLHLDTATDANGILLSMDVIF